MIKLEHGRLCTLLLALVVGLVASSSASASATITIQNNDGANTGFNDPTPVAPVGGNSGTTVGQQRLNAFMFAASIWGATINSGPTITISAKWANLTCNSQTGVLGSAGSVGMQRDFPNAPFAGTWYSTALANAISGTDQNVGAEINAQFNMNIGTPNCLPNSFWYYGLDGNHGNGIDLVAVLLHEFAHGLGFQTFTSGSTGALSSGLPTVYDRFLRDNTTGKLWVNMTDAERVASAINTGNLVWAGPQVTGDVPNVLTGTPRIRVNSPPGFAGNFDNIGLADFGSPLNTSGVTANVAATNPVDGCSAVGGSVAGKIAFIDRGNCNFTVKVKNAQNAGAVAVIIGNVLSSTSPTVPPGMSGTDPTITIPSVSLNLADADAFRAQLGNSINASVLIDLSSLAGADSANHARMYAPNPFSGGSSVSHFDTSMFPNQLMEPNNSSDLTHSVTPPQDLTFSLLRDIGWSVAGGPPPPPPANDNFSAAQTITGCSGNVGGTNVGGTNEAGEPNHSPDNGGGTRSVWYRWQAQSTGIATITTAGSNFDTVLAVYTGSSVNALTPVVKNDDVDPGIDISSSVQFSATAGTTYMIAVDGYDNSSGGDTGSITLNWSLANCTQVPPQLILEDSGPVANEAAALDSVLFVRDPFPVINTSNLFNLPADPNTRILIFVANLQLAQGEPASAVTVNLIDSNNTAYNIAALDVESVPNQTFSQVTFRLPNTLAVGTCQIKVVVHSQTSNTAVIRIKS